MDAPLTPTRINQIPKEGRTIDKVFSKSKFSSGNGNRGPQPGSIKTPRPGWFLYNAGMDLVSIIADLNQEMNYISLLDFMNGKKKGIIEIIPKLTQSLLVPKLSVTGRGKNKIDDYLFPRLFDTTGDDRIYLDNALDNWRLDHKLESVIGLIAQRPKKYHEELASIIAAVQGAMLLIGRASIVGFCGENEGYYLLPQIDRWHPFWKDVFWDVKKDYPKLVIL